MATLSIINNFSITNLGHTDADHQGLPGSGSASTDAFAVTVSGQTYVTPFSIATATAQKMWDTSANYPATFAYFYFNADQNFYIQFIGTTATNCVVVTTKGVPFILSSQSILPAASSTPISGSAPTTTLISKIYIQQNSGSTSYGTFALIL